MKALVGIKRVIDHTVKIRIKNDFTGVEKNAVKFSINPFCEIAIEEAVRLKEKGIITHISALTIGDKNSSETLKHALALGADDGYHIQVDQQTDIGFSSLTVSKVLQYMVNKENFDMVLLGKQSIDSDFNHTAQMLSGMLNWPLITFASEIKKEGNKFNFLREIDTGMQRLTVEAPFVMSCDLRLNTPRYSSLKAITAAKKKKVTNMKLEELGLKNDVLVKIEKIESPPAKAAGVKVADVDELINKLRNEAKLI